MGFVSLILLVLGWLLIIFSTFGSGLVLNIGSLSGLEVGEVFVLAALCVGAAPGWVSTVRGN